MKKILCVLLAVSFIPGIALAQNVGKCGWGSKLFDGQKGIIPQVFAVTTNGTSYNQTFAITSGTSGCTQDGMVKSSWRTAAFIDANMNRLAKDISRGEGETLQSLVALLEVEQQDQDVVKSELQGNFKRLFASTDVTSNQVAAELRMILSENSSLSQYAQNV